MRKILIGSSALLAAGLIAAPSMAQDADGMMGPTPLTGANLDLALGGNAAAKFEYRSAETKGSDAESFRNHAVTFDAELHFKAEATLANGTSFGAHIELEGIRAGDNKYIDENYIWVDGRLGKVYLGGYDGRPSTDVATSGGIFSSNDLLKIDAGANAALIGNRIDSGGKNNKIAWQSPELGGMSIAFNYTPDPQNMDTGLGETDTDVNQSQTAMYLGGKLVTAMGDAEVSLSLGYATVSAENDGDDVDDSSKLRFGAQVAVSDINVRLYYVRGDADAVKDTPTAAVSQIGLGADYTFGDWKVGAGWERGSQAQFDDAGDADGDDQASRMDIALERGLDNGMEVEFGWRRTSYADNAEMAKDEQSHSELAVIFRWDVGPGLEFDVEFANATYTHHMTDPADAESESRRANSLRVITKVSF